MTRLSCAQVRKNRVAMKTFVMSEVDPADVPYLEASREKQRKKTLARKMADGTDSASLKAKRVREREAKAGALSCLLPALIMIATSDSLRRTDVSLKLDAFF
jgi:hypothetical protein